MCVCVCECVCVYVCMYVYIYIYTQGSKLTFLLGSTGAPNFKKLGAPQLF